MAVATIIIQAGKLTFVAWFFSGRYMVMAMVTKMRGVFLIVLAIRGCGRPGILDRQSKQQKNEEYFFHR